MKIYILCDRTQEMLSGQWRLLSDRLEYWWRQFAQLPQQQQDALHKATHNWRKKLPKDTRALEQLLGFAVGLENDPPQSQDLSTSSEHLLTQPINAQHAWLSSINPLLCVIAPEYQKKAASTRETLQSFLQAAQQVARRLRQPQPLGADYLPVTDQQNLVVR